MTNPLETRTPLIKRMLGKPKEHRVEVTGISVWPPNRIGEDNITRIYMRTKGVWRIEESLVEMSNN